MTESSGNDGGDDLSRRIAEAQAKHGRGVTNAEGQAETRGWAIGIEFVGAVLVSGFVGWSIDHWLAPRFAPWGMIVLLVLGFAAGVRRAMTTSAEFDTDPTNASDD